MKKTLKIIAIIAGCIIGIVMLCSVAAHVVVNTKGKSFIGRKIHVTHAYVDPFTGLIRLSNVDIKEADEVTTFLHVDRLSTRINLFSLMRHRVRLAHLRLTDSDINVISENNQYNFSDIVEFFTSDSTNDEPNTESKPWTIDLKRISFKHSDILFNDKTHNKRWDIRDMNIHIPRILLDDEHTDAGIQLELPNKGGILSVKGKLMDNMNRFSIDIKSEVLDISRAMPLITQYVNLRSIDATVDGQLTITGRFDNLLATAIRGKVTIDDLDIKRERRHSLLRCSKAILDIKDISLRESRLELNALKIDSMEVNLLTTNSGNSLTGLLAENKDESKEAEESSGSATNEKAEGGLQKAVIHIGELSIARSSINYTDKTLPSYFEYSISNITGSGTDIDTYSATNHIMLSGDLPHGGSMMVNWRGALDIEDSNARIVAMLRNVQLADLSPWSEYMFGYPLKDGTMAISSDNSIIHGTLDATERIDIYKAEVGKKMKHHTPKVDKIPLRAGIGLLEDVNGKVELNVPITGDLSDANFSLSEVIGKAVGNVFLQAVGSPFIAMAKAKNKNVDLSEIDFDNIMPDLGLEQYQKLDLIAEMMRENEDIKLTLQQSYSPSEAIADRALFNLRKDFYQSLNNQKLGELTLIDIEKIQAIKTNNADFQNYYKSVLSGKGNVQARAIDYYGEEALYKEVKQTAKRRNEFILEYLTKQQGISKKRISVVTLEEEELKTHKGKSRYIVDAKVEDK